MSAQSPQPPDPLKRDTPPGSTPLQSPMPRSRVLDNEEPELNTGEDDVAREDKHDDDGAHEHAAG